MTTEHATDLGDISLLPIRARAAFGLAVAQAVVQVLAADPPALALAQEALQLSWEWVNGAPVKGADIGLYMESVTEKDLSNYEVVYTKGGPMLEAVCAIVLAVAYTARKAYDAEGVKTMSDSLWAIDETTLGEMIVRAKASSRYNGDCVQQVRLFLHKRYAGQSAGQLGSPVSAAEVLPLLGA